MSEYSQSWKRRLRLQILVDLAKKELESEKEFNEISQKLDQEMWIRWKLVISTRKQYLEIIKKILENKFILIHSI
jgi:hypothetical protein